MLTREDILSLDPKRHGIPELVLRHVMGGISRHPDKLYWYLPEMPDIVSMSVVTFRPHIDLNAASCMEDRLEQIGLTRTYSMILRDLVLEGLANDYDRTDELWLVAHAPALLKVKAALLAVSTETQS